MLGATAKEPFCLTSTDYRNLNRYFQNERKKKFTKVDRNRGENK